MSVSKRLRFEIFRRDNFACRYCGAQASATTLTIDHVIPTALGGTDDPGNLVAACADCNSGKSATSLDAAVVADVADDALRWARAQHAAAEVMLADQAARDGHRAEFKAAWDQWEGRNGSPMPLPGQWPESVDRFVAVNLPMPVLLDCLDKALRNPRIRDPFSYMCGIAWKRVGELQQAATAAVAPAVSCQMRGGSPYQDAVSMLTGQLSAPEKLGDAAYVRHMVKGFGEATEGDEDVDGNPVDYSSWSDDLKATIHAIKEEFDAWWEWTETARYVAAVVLKEDHDQCLARARKEFSEHGLDDPGPQELERYALMLAARSHIARTSPPASADPWAEA